MVNKATPEKKRWPDKRFCAKVGKELQQKQLKNLLNFAAVRIFTQLLEIRLNDPPQLKKKTLSNVLQKVKEWYSLEHFVLAFLCTF